TTTLVNFLFPAELIEALNNKTDYASKAKERSEFCVTTSVEGDYRIYSGGRAIDLYQAYQPPAEGTEAQGQLSGTPACRGTVTGVVRVIRRDSDFEKFQ